jgi:PST family polysaccharide transporter
MFATVFQKAVNLAFLAVFARKLAPGQFDAYIYAVAFGMFFETFSDFGMDFVLSRELNQRPEREHGRIVGSAMGAKVLAFAITFALAALVALLKPEYRNLALIATLGIFCGIPGTIGVALRSRVEMGRPELLSTISGIVIAVGLVVAVQSGASVTMLVTTQVGLRIVTALLILPLLRRRLVYRLEYDPVLARQLARAALPIALSTFAVIVFARIDQLMLGILGKVGDVGGYGVAVRVVDGINFIPTAVASIALPTFSHLEGHDNARLRRLSERGIRYLAIVILPLAVLATVAGGQGLALMFGEQFRQHGTTLAVLAWAQFFASSWVLARPVLVARHQASWLSILAIVAAVVNVALIAWLIPSYGGVGAAWASLIAYASPFAVAAFAPAVRDSFAAPLRAAIQPLIAALAVLFVLLPISSTAVRLVAFVVLMPIALVVTRAISIREVKEMLRSFAKGR